ncbi:MAG: hypothetical protein NT007_00835 [Candidatus Kapabacteria bacterium]|nr:hypothetical protein [Candidatus Kapabacteria bacterium]
MSFPGMRESATSATFGDSYTGINERIETFETASWLLIIRIKECVTTLMTGEIKKIFNLLKRNKFKETNEFNNNRKKSA